MCSTVIIIIKKKKNPDKAAEIQEIWLIKGPVTRATTCPR